MPYNQPPEGNDWGAFASSQPGSLPPPGQLSGIAFLSLPNVFTDVNTFDGGIRFSETKVSADYTITHNDYEILVDASGGDIAITLPPAIGDGQLYRVKKTDSTANTVVVFPQPGDLIDGTTGIFLAAQWEACSLIDADTNYWDKVSDPTGTIPSDVARQGSPNVFTALNTFSGLRVAVQTVDADTLLTDNDFEVLVDATTGPITITLPASTGEGQYYRIKKIDASANVVTIQADGSDLIDGSTSLNFIDQYADCTIVDAAMGYWDNTGSAATGGDAGSVTSSQLASVSATLESHINAVSLAGVTGGASVTSAEISALVQTASAAATSADAHANTVSARVVSVSAELGSLVQIASAAATSADAHANTVSGRVVSVSAELASLVQIASAAATSADAHAGVASAAAAVADSHANTVSARVVSVSAELASLVQIASAAATSADAHADMASAAATSADAHVNAVSARVVSVSAELGSLIQIASAAATTASAAATSADNHANTVSQRVVSVSAELGSLLNSASAALEAHINAVSLAGVTGGASVTSQEVSVLVNTASVAATSADAHANTVSARVVSVSAELTSLLASVSATLETHIVAASAAATSADGHANTVSARVVSVSAELGSLIQIASAAATSVNAHANTISARVVSVSAELTSLLASASATLETHIVAASAAATSADAHAATASLAATSADGHANTVSARVVSVSAELASLLASASATLETHVVAASAAATSAINKAVSDNTSLSAVLATSIQTASAAATSADAHANTVSARLASASLELVSLVQIASAAATSADGHANTVSARVVSVSAELASLINIVSAAGGGGAQTLSLQNVDVQALSAGAPVYAFTSANTFKRAVASAPALTKNILGLIADNSIPVSAVGRIQTGGVITLTTAQWDDMAGTTGGLTPGTTYYVSQTTGRLTSTIPAQPTNFVLRPVGTALSSTQLLLRIDALDEWASIFNNVSANDNVGSAARGLQEAFNAVSNRVSALSSLVSTLSIDMASHVQAASAAATSAINKAVSDNTSLSAAIMADVASHLASALSGITGGSGSVTSAELNVVSARVVSVSAETASLVQIASAAVTSVDTKLNLEIGVRSSVDMDIVSQAAATSLRLNDVNSALTLFTSSQTVINTNLAAGISVASAAATSVNSRLDNVSAKSEATSVKGLQSVINQISNRISAIPTADAVSARVVSVSAELASLIQIASAAATSADAHANTVSGRAASISAEVVSLFASASATLETHINTVSGNVVSGVITLTNKRISKRTSAITTSATPAINTDNVDVYTITALGAAITSMTTGLSGAPTEGQSLLIWIKDDGTARAIAWGASFGAMQGLALPTTTIVGQYTYAVFIYNATVPIWIMTATTQY